MTERENILTRVREALTVKSPARYEAGLPTIAEHRRVLPPANAELELFARNAAELKANFKIVKDETQLALELAALRDSQQWQRVATHKSHLAEALGLPLLLVDGGFNKHELEQCDVGITECDTLVAQTGTVVVTSRSAGGRALSCLPPHHVVIARASQLVSDLPAAFALIKQKYGAQYPSMISFITGPSRTGDIERILVLGAHGPKQLTIFCILE